MEGGLKVNTKKTKYMVQVKVFWVVQCSAVLAVSSELVTALTAVVRTLG